MLTAVSSRHKNGLQPDPGWASPERWPRPLSQDCSGGGARQPYKSRLPITSMSTRQRPCTAKLFIYRRRRARSLHPRLRRLSLTPGGVAGRPPGAPRTAAVYTSIYIRADWGWTPKVIGPDKNICWVDKYSNEARRRARLTGPRGGGAGDARHLQFKQGAGPPSSQNPNNAAAWRHGRRFNAFIGFTLKVV